jgi:hypothetical protein
MSNIKISNLPLKRLLADGDFLPIVDTQFGSGSYINKRTTVGDLADFVRQRISGSFTVDGGVIKQMTFITDETYCRAPLLIEGATANNQLLLETAP